MELVLTYGSNKTLTTEFETKNYSKKTIYYNNLKYADNSVNLSIPYSKNIQDTIAQYADSNIKAQVKDGTKVIFTGYLRKSFKFSKKQRNQPIALEIVSPNILLDKQITTNETLINKKVDEIITNLLSKTSYSGTTTVPSALKFVITPFFLKDGDNIKDVLSNLLFELGYQYDFDNNGNISIYEIFNNSGTITQHFNGTNSIDEIVVNKKEQEYSGVKVSYKPVSYGFGDIFIDNTGGNGGKYDCKIELAPHTYLSSSDADATSYYIQYGTSYGEFLWCASTPSALGITVSETENGSSYHYTTKDWLTVSFTNLGDKGEISIYNKTSKTLWIRNLYISTYHYYNKELATSVSSKGTKFYEYEAKYIGGANSAKTKADDLASKYADWYNYSDYTITVKSNTDYALGSLVNVTDVGFTNINGRIIEKTEKLDGSPIQYKIEAISDYTPSTATTTIRQNAIFNTVGIKADVPTPYEIDCPSVYKPGDTITFNFYKVENNSRTSATLYYIYQTSANGSTWGTEITGTGSTYTSNVLITEKKARIRIYESKTSTEPLAESVLSLVTDGLNGGHQEYLFAAGAFDLSPAQIRALDWFPNPPDLTSSAPCLYMATKWISGN